MMFYAADYRRLARENLRGNWWLSIAVVFMATLLGGPLGGSSLSIEIPDAVVPLVQKYLLGLAPLLMMYTIVLSGLGLAKLILGGAISLGNAQYHLDQYDHKPLAFKTLFSKFEQFGAGLCLYYLTALYCLLWGLVPLVPGIIIGMLLDLFSTAYVILLVVLFIIPLAIASYSCAMAFYVLVEYPGMRARDAIRASRDMMRGYKWDLFCLSFSFIGWHILCILTLGVGNLFVGPYVSAAEAAFYRQLRAPRATYAPENTTASAYERKLSQ